MLVFRRIISTLLDRFKEKEKAKPGRRSLSEPRQSYTDLSRVKASNLSDTSFAAAVSKIQDETLESLRNDHIQKENSETTRRFDDDKLDGSESPIGEGASVRRRRLTTTDGQYNVEEVYSSTMEQLAAAMAFNTMSPAPDNPYRTSSRGASVPRSSPQMAAPPNFEWYRLSLCRMS